MQDALSTNIVKINRASFLNTEKKTKPKLNLLHATYGSKLGDDLNSLNQTTTQRYGKNKSQTVMKKDASKTPRSKQEPAYMRLYNFSSFSKKSSEQQVSPFSFIKSSTVRYANKTPPSKNLKSIALSAFKALEVKRLDDKIKSEVNLTANQVMISPPSSQTLDFPIHALSERVKVSQFSFIYSACKPELIKKKDTTYLQQHTRNISDFPLISSEEDGDSNCSVGEQQQSTSQEVRMGSELQSIDSFRPKIEFSGKLRIQKAPILINKIKPFDVSQIPIIAFIKIIDLESSLLKILMVLCKGLRNHLLFELKSQCQSVLQQLQNIYKNQLELVSTYLWSQEVMYADRQYTRIDRVFRLHVNKNLNGKVCEITCTANRQESTRRVFIQQTKFRFDCFNQRESRWQWVHKCEEEFHGQSDVRSYCIPVTPVCATDQIEISVTIMSLMGSVDQTTIEWLPLHLEKIPDQDKIRNYNRAQSMTPDRDKLQKYFADLSRVCEVEDTVSEWFDKQFYVNICTDGLKRHIRHQIDDFLFQVENQFQVLRVEVGGIDNSVWKICLRAHKKEKKNNESQYYQDINATFQIVDGPLVNEVKKVGVIIDRGSQMTFRDGDQLIIYVSMGGFEK